MKELRLLEAVRFTAAADLLAGSACLLPEIGELRLTHRESHERSENGGTVITAPAVDLTFDPASDDADDVSSLLARVTDALGISRAEVDASWRTVVDDLHAGRTIAVDGFGQFSTVGDEVRFDPEPSLRTAVNARYSGLLDLEIMRGGIGVGPALVDTETDDLQDRSTYDLSAPVSKTVVDQNMELILDPELSDDDGEDFELETSDVESATRVDDVDDIDDVDEVAPDDWPADALTTAFVPAASEAAAPDTEPGEHDSEPEGYHSDRPAHGRVATEPDPQHTPELMRTSESMDVDEDHPDQDQPYVFDSGAHETEVDVPRGSDAADAGDDEHEQPEPHVDVPRDRLRADIEGTRTAVAGRPAHRRTVVALISLSGLSVLAILGWQIISGRSADSGSPPIVAPNALAPTEQTTGHASPAWTRGAFDVTAGGFTIIVSSKETEAEAVEVAREFAIEGTTVDILEASVGDETRYRVGVGQYDTFELASQVLTQNTGRLPQGSWIGPIE